MTGPRWLSRPDGAAIAWYDDGLPSAPAVLLLMGLGYPAAAWFRTVTALAGDYRLLRPDNRGAGLTGDVPGGPYSVETMAEDAVAVLDEAGVDAAHVIGISMGGTLAQELALTHPGRVRSLALLATHPGAAQSVWDPEAMALLGARGQAGPAQAAEASIPFNYAPGTPRQQIEEDWAIRLPLAASPQGYAHQLTGTSGWSSLDRLAGLTVPTLVMSGALDRLVLPENGRTIADAIPGAEYVLVPGANHLMTTDQPDVVHGVLLDWLHRREKGSRS